MKRIERLNLISIIGRRLQADMTTSDINAYLAEFGLDCRDGPTTVGSKWVYVKDLLGGEPDETILKIADELEIDHALSVRRDLNLADSPFWAGGHFRLFLSHVSASKSSAARLQRQLRRYGTSAFVAHEDIEPTKEWLQEIEKALLSMDALAAILTPGFGDSKWTDQEVGIALGRDVLVVPLRKGLDPYGFVARYQGVQTEGRTVGQVAAEIFHILATNQKTRRKMADVLVGLILSASCNSEAEHRLELLSSVPKVPTESLEKLRENFRGTRVLISSQSLLRDVNALLERHHLPQVETEEAPVDAFADDVPF